MERNQIIHSNLITLNEQHFHQLKAIHRECLPHTEYSDKTYMSFLTNNNYKSHAIIDENNSMLGFIIMIIESNEGDIISIGTKKQSRKMGVASKLLKNCIELYGLKKLFLEVACTNTTAISFYKKQGFLVVNTRKNYTTNQYGQAVNAYLMRMEI